MKVKSVEVIVGKNGPDLVILDLDAPTPYPNMGHPASAEIRVANGYGVEWAKQVFPEYSIQVTDYKTGNINFFKDKK